MLENNKRYLKIIIVALILVTLIVLGLIIKKYYDNSNMKNILENIQIDESEKKEGKTERVLQVEQLQKDNSDIVGWIEIEDTKINYPVLQTTDNDYYLTHTYQKKRSPFGSIFLDKDYDFQKPSSNLLIYGHRDKNGTMFEDLIKFKKENFYKEHKKIRFTTPEEDCEYEILAVFNSRVYYEDEVNVFRYYFFVNAKNEKDFNEYVENCKKSSIYNTGVTAQYGDQLLTLSTCDYTTENGRFAVVAKKIIANK